MSSVVLISSLYIFQFMGKDPKLLSFNHCVTPLKIQSITDESLVTILFVDPSVKQLKGLKSARLVSVPVTAAAAASLEVRLAVCSSPV